MRDVAKLTPLQKARRKWILKKRTELGLCRYCGAEAHGLSCCDRCRRRITNKQRAKRLRRKERNVCTDCKAPVKKGQYHCDDCLKKKYGEIICHTNGCNNTIVRNHLYCNECIEKRDQINGSCNVWFKECPVCGSLFTTQWELKIYCCNECINAINYYGKNVKVEWRECEECNKLYKTYDKNKSKRYCSQQCSKKAAGRNGKHTRRLRKKAAFIEVVNIAVLFNRDNGRCQLCRRKLNLKRKVPHSMAATVDHIIPLSLGGEHSYRNTQLACFECNCNKGERFVANGEQLRLIGI